MPCGPYSASTTLWGLVGYRRWGETNNKTTPKASLAHPVLVVLYDGELAVLIGELAVVGDERKGRQGP